MACMEDRRVAYRVVVQRPEGKSHLEELGIDGRIMLTILQGWGGMDWIAVTQDRNRWWAVVNVVMNLWVP